LKGIARILTVLLIISSGVMGSCSHRLAVSDPVIVHDTVYTSVNTYNSFQDKPGTPDSSIVTALLKCDSLGNIYIKSITQLQGEVVNQTIQLKENQLRIQAMSKTREISKVTRKDSVRTITVEKAVPYPVERVTNRLTEWQSFQIWTGRLVLLGALIFLIIKFAPDILKVITKLFK
jgi:hypothetical protein